jgi:stage V sporulation protein B
LLAGVVGTSLLSSIDTITLTYFRTLSEVGLYNAALPVANILRYLSKPVYTLLLPVSSELKALHYQKFGDGVRRLQRLLIAGLAPFAFALAVFAPVALAVLFGGKYLDAAPALTVLAIGSIPMASALVNINILLGVGKPGINTIAQLLGAGVSVIANLSLVPFFGIIGAAIGTSLGGFAMFVYSTIHVQREVGSTMPYLSWVKSLVAGSILFGALTFIPQLPVPDWLNAIMLSTLAGICYLAALLLLRVTKVSEIQMLISRILK